MEADLLLHLAEVDERKLYLERPFPSMFAFCVDELGFSDDAAYYRITVARAGRRFPAILEAVREGKVHLAGLRLLVPHLTQENHREVLAQATGRSKREIEEIAARLAPLPPVPDSIRRVGVLAPGAATGAALLAQSPIAAHPPGTSGAGAAGSPRTQAVQRGIIAPLSAETFRVEFTAPAAFRDKLREAQDLLRHRVPDGNLAEVLGRALDVLIEQVKKERFAVGRKARDAPEDSEGEASSRHIPDAIKRAVHERDGGRCTFVDAFGNRCPETGGLEFEHEDGYACTHRHEVDRIRLLCRPHNQYSAEQRYGRAFMERARARARSTRPGASSEKPMLL